MCAGPHKAREMGSFAVCWKDLVHSNELSKTIFLSVFCLRGTTNDHSLSLKMAEDKFPGND